MNSITRITTWCTSYLRRTSTKIRVSYLRISYIPFSGTLIKPSALGLINIRALPEFTDPEDEKKRDAPDIIYPEFIIVADYSLFM